MKKILKLFLVSMVAYLNISQNAMGACDKKTLNEGIYAAQTLSTASPTFLNKLALCPQMAIKEQAVFWGAFYFKMTNNESQTVNLIDKAFSEPKSAAEQDQIYFQARRGRWQRLKKKIDSGEPEYLANLNARIILAHSLFYSRRYEDGLNVYREYLKIKANDDLLDGEYLFALIWAGEYELAQARVRSLTRFTLGPYLRMSTLHAQKILDQRKTGEAVQDEIITVKGTLSTGFGRFNSYLGDRQSFYAGYKDNVGFDFSSHLIDSELDDKRYPASEVAFSYKKVNESTFFKSRIGYLGVTKGTLTGRLEFGAFFENFSISGGIERIPLLLEYTLSRLNQNVTTNQIFTNLTFSYWFEYIGILSRENELSPYETHKINFNLPLYYKKNGQGLFLFAPLYLRSQPKPSPFYESRPKTFMAQSGIKYDYILSNATSLALTAVVGSRYRNSIANPDAYETTIQIDGEFSLKTKVTKKIDLTFKALIRDNSKEEFSNEDYESDYLEIGLLFTPN